ncbi:hypothetical protein [Streptomyces eurythermus]
MERQFFFINKRKIWKVGETAGLGYAELTSFRNSGDMGARDR